MEILPIWNEKFQNLIFKEVEWYCLFWTCWTDNKEVVKPDQNIHLLIGKCEQRKKAKLIDIVKI